MDVWIGGLLMIECFAQNECLVLFRMPKETVWFHVFNVLEKVSFE